MKRMSFAMTPNQMLDKSKTVTRRLGWGFLSPGDYLKATIRDEGGGGQREIGFIRVKSVNRVPLDSITQEDVAKEGFPEHNPAWFIAKFCVAFQVGPRSMVTRIEFEHCTRDEAIQARGPF